ncbi:MAG: hypothetical protein R2838_15370 [Caldilineaceae bacterium]
MSIGFDNNLSRLWQFDLELRKSGGWGIKTQNRLSFGRHLQRTDKAGRHQHHRPRDDTQGLNADGRTLLPGLVWIPEGDKKFYVRLRLERAEYTNNPILRADKGNRIRRDHASYGKYRKGCQ